MSRTSFFLAALLAIGVTPQASAADAKNGGRLAEQWCASCHIVEPSQNHAAADAPPFPTIARQPGFSAHRLAFFLLDPHPKMPNMGLSRDEANDLAAYIESLR